MKKIIRLTLLLILAVSCKKDPTYHENTYKLGGGVFILNEGNYRGGNGSLSFYSYDSTKIFNDLFSSKNNRPLGDVPNSMMIHEDNGYIVVNNSGKIEVIDPITLVSKTTITGLNSPRYIVPVSSTRAYVSSLYSDSVTIIDMTNNSIVGYINIRRSSEAILAGNNKAYVTNWAGGNEVMVINTLTNKIVDSIQVGNEPESMVLDRNLNLWVLCSGTYAGDDFAKLVQINISTDKVTKEYKFPTKEASPTCLRIDALGNTIYYLDNGVKAMEINLGKLPVSALIADPNSSFYKIGINPVNGDIFVTDAVDYSSRGWVLIYKSDGSIITMEKADIIPASMCFKLRVN
jgi:YVTN family beta-propeller protein